MGPSYTGFSMPRVQQIEDCRVQRHTVLTYHAGLTERSFEGIVVSHLLAYQGNVMPVQD
jgi:hypothetical protein